MSACASRSKKLPYTPPASRCSTNCNKNRCDGQRKQRHVCLPCLAARRGGHHHPAPQRPHRVDGADPVLKQRTGPPQDGSFSCSSVSRPSMQARANALVVRQGRNRRVCPARFSRTPDIVQGFAVQPVPDICDFKPCGSDVAGTAVRTLFCAGRRELCHGRVKQAVNLFKGVDSTVNFFNVWHIFFHSSCLQNNKAAVVYTKTTPRHTNFSDSFLASCLPGRQKQIRNLSVWYSLQC